MTYEKLVRNIGAEVEISKSCDEEQLRGKRGKIVVYNNSLRFQPYEGGFTYDIPAEDYILLSPSPNVSYTEEDLRDMARAVFQQYDGDSKAFYQFSGRLKEVFRELREASIESTIPPF